MPTLEATDAIAQQFAPTSTSLIELDGAVDNGVCAISLPGVMSYIEPEMRNADGLLQKLLATTEHVTAINYEGSAADMNTLAAETAVVIKQQLTDCQKVLVISQSYGGHVAVNAISKANLTNGEKKRLALVIDDSPSGYDTMKSPLKPLTRLVVPGPFANLLTSPILTRYSAPNSKHTFSFSQFTEQIQSVDKEGVPNTDALKGIDRVAYVSADPELDQQVVQPDAREDWMAVLPNGTELIITKGQHANYEENPATYNSLIDDILNGS